MIYGAASWSERPPSDRVTVVHLGAGASPARFARVAATDAAAPSAAASAFATSGTGRLVARGAGSAASVFIDTGSGRLVARFSAPARAMLFTGSGQSRAVRRGAGTAPMRFARILTESLFASSETSFGGSLAGRAVVGSSGGGRSAVAFAASGGGGILFALAGRSTMRVAATASGRLLWERAPEPFDRDQWADAERPAAEPWTRVPPASGSPWTP